MTKLPTLYKKTSTGKIQEWTIFVQKHGAAFHGEPAEIVTVYGLSDGKKQTAVEIIRDGKNIGKANETTPLEQAQLEAKSQWEKKVKKGYVENVADAQDDKIDTNLITGGINPMLAHSFDKQGHKIQWPAFVQPKLDGHRCIAIVQDGVCTLWSRTRKPITSMPHIVEQLERSFPNGTIILDGELYNHEYRDKFEQLTSYIRSSTPKPGHTVVQYWVYDIAGTDLPFVERKKLLHEVESETKFNNANSIVVVATFEAEDQDDMVRLFDVFLDNEYEGAIVRSGTGKYEGKRSYGLQKVKLMQDTEFPVVAVEEGRGKMAGRAMFVCEAPNGQTFRVKMKGALDDLVAYYQNPDPWIGRQLTVQFQKWSAEGMPIFPVALRFREDV